MVTYVDLNFKNVEENIIDSKAINASLSNIFSINLTELEGSPEFGASKKILFEPMDNITIDAYKTVMRSIVKRFEPRIRIDEFIVDTYPDQHRLEIRINYTVIATNINGTFVTNLQ